jgi:hypothetical protein
MSSSAAILHLDRYLFGFALLLFGGSLMELVFAEHWGEAIRLIPCDQSLTGLATTRCSTWRS